MNWTFHFNFITILYNTILYNVCITSTISKHFCKISASKIQKKGITTFVLDINLNNFVQMMNNEKLTAKYE